MKYPVLTIRRSDLGVGPVSASDTDLSGVDLSGASLSGADLSGASFRYARRWAEDSLIPGWILRNGELVREVSR